MKNLLIKYSLATVILISISILACNKSSYKVDIQNSEKKNKITRQVNWPIEITIKIYKGTRKNDDTSTASPCDGRSFCIKGTIDYLNIDNEYGENNEYYLAHLIATSNTSSIIFRVYDNESSESVRNEIFESDYFEMDSNYQFSSAISTPLYRSSLLLPSGQYALTRGTNYTEFSF